jgi:hypothetical protein
VRSERLSWLCSVVFTNPNPNPNPSPNAYECLYAMFTGQYVGHVGHVGMVCRRRIICRVLSRMTKEQMVDGKSEGLGVELV